MFLFYSFTNKFPFSYLSNGRIFMKKLHKDIKDFFMKYPEVSNVTICDLDSFRKGDMLYKIKRK